MSVRKIHTIECQMKRHRQRSKENKEKGIKKEDERRKKTNEIE